MDFDEITIQCTVCGHELQHMDYDCDIIMVWPCGCNPPIWKHPDWQQAKEDAETVIRGDDDEDTD